jgi:hypothetical protein
VQEGTYTYDNVAHDANITYDITGDFDKIVLTSPSGFTQLKQLDVSGLRADPVPESSTWVMMLAGFGLIGLGALWRQRQELGLV